MNFRKNTEETLKEIVNKFEDEKIEFIIIGGLAALYYGSKRDLADIDIGVSKKELHRISKIFNSKIKENYIYGYKDSLWSLDLVIFNFNDQIVDIFDRDTLKFHSNKTLKWETIDMNKKSEVDYFGITLTMLNKDELIRYKLLLDREVDKIDVKNLSS